MPFVTLVSLVLLGGVVGLLCFNTQMQQASFAATSLEAQADNLTAREQTLHDELQDLRNPQHLATLAQRPAWSSRRARARCGSPRGTTEAGLHRGHRRQHPDPAGPAAQEARRPRPRAVRGRRAPPPPGSAGHHGAAGSQGGDTARR